jgi:hypothetical protein
MKISSALEKHRQIVETLVHLIRPQAKMMEEGCDVCYVFSREEYEFLADRMGALVAVAKEIFVDVRKDLEGYAALCSRDDGTVDKINDMLKKATATCDLCKKAVNDFLTLLGHYSCRVKNDPSAHTSMPVDTYRMFILACIGFYTDMEWTKGTITRGDEEKNFTEKEG